MPFNGKETATTPIYKNQKTIMVDGVERPAQNSNGQPIHWSEEGVRNFWRGFDNSVVVDAGGRPLVVYHGTGADITEFDKPKKGARTSHFLDIGFHFGSPSLASDYAARAEFGGKVQSSMSRDGKKGDPSIYPVYLNAVNVIDIRNGIPEESLNSVVELGIEHGLSRNSKYTKLAKVDPLSLLGEVQRLAGRAKLRKVFTSAGYDGIKYSFDGDAYVVFEPTQIKSAIGNNGQFDANNPDIRYSKDGRILAFVRGSETFLVADNISSTDDNVKGLLTHEISSHALELGLSTPEYLKIVHRFKAMARMGNKKAQAGMNRVPADTHRIL